MSAARHKIRVIDSHTGGEPTRVVIEGAPDLGAGPVVDQLARFRSDYSHFRSAIVNEPRGSDMLVGAWLVPPAEPESLTGVIFFNNVGWLGMCGHGMIGVIQTLQHLGRIRPGDYLIETPVGRVRTTLHADHSVDVANVASYRQRRHVTIEVPGIGPIQGDVAWGGNWFFLVEDHDQELSRENLDQLLDRSWRIRQAVNAQGFPEVDHVELFGPPALPEHDARNFVLCPGRAFDRSPCGTGTSAKLACLAADGLLLEGMPWVQEGILGSTFTARYSWLDRDAGTIEPIITGQAFVHTEATLLLDEDDPFCWGIA